MTLLEAIKTRHSIRRYVDRPLDTHAVEVLNRKIAEVNQDGNLHIQLVLNEPKAFKGGLAYGTFSGVSSYLVMAGVKDDTLGERIGYYGEQLVLLAQTLGINSCWAGLTYKKIADTYTIEKNEKILCYIALGYGENQGVQHKSKSLSDVSNAGSDTPEWFTRGVEAALLAPTAVNQQKFYFEYLGGPDGKLPKVRATAKFSIVGYTKIDLGIAKLHFEIGADRKFEWI